MTLICVPIFVEDPASALADAHEALHRGADLVEFRVDSFFTGGRDPAAQAEAERIVAMVGECKLPCIVTCRPVLEGGQYDGPDDLRISLFERLGTMAGPPAGGASRPMQHPPRYIDVELLTYTRSENLKQKVNLGVDHPAQVRELSTSLILSTHDFHTRPLDLIRRIEQMFQEPACAVAKVAYRARSIRDNLELLDILLMAQEHGKPMIALGMGPYGLMSRVLAPKFNGFLTFASLRRQSATAPGQPVISDLVDLYRFRSINSATKVYGVVGDPVEHSISPMVHNAGFEAVGHDGVYLPMPIPAGYEHFKATVLAMLDHPGLDLAGLSVTIPHKENLVRLAREEWAEGDGRWEVDLLSEQCGAGNTLIVRRDGKGRATNFEVRNTDGAAAADAVFAAVPELRRAAVLGAGGTARAVAAALRNRGVEVMIVNRSQTRALALKADLEGPSAELVEGEASNPARLPALKVLEASALAAAKPQAVINCTPVGMAGGPAPNESAISWEVLCNLSDQCVVADCVYRPLTTPLLAQAASRHLRCIDGLAMFLGQAAEQFSLWTDRSAPMQLFQTVARESLA